MIERNIKAFSYWLIETFSKSYNILDELRNILLLGCVLASVPRTF